MEWLHLQTTHDSFPLSFDHGGATTCVVENTHDGEGIVEFSNCPSWSRWLLHIMLTTSFDCATSCWIPVQSGSMLMQTIFSTQNLKIAQSLNQSCCVYEEGCCRSGTWRCVHYSESFLLGLCLFVCASLLHQQALKATRLPLYREMGCVEEKSVISSFIRQKCWSPCARFLVACRVELGDTFLFAWSLSCRVRFDIVHSIYGLVTPFLFLIHVFGFTAGGSDEEIYVLRASTPVL